jgi:hypothetical protein
MSALSVFLCVLLDFARSVFSFSNLTQGTRRKAKGTENPRTGLMLTPTVAS